MQVFEMFSTFSATNALKWYYEPPDLRLTIFSRYGPTPQVWFHKSKEKVVQLRGTTKTVSKEKEIACYTS